MNFFYEGYFGAPLEIHSIPKDPTPEYRSRRQLSILILLNVSVYNIKNISLTDL